ncbi:hypothetical protein CcaverHIS002_0100530 [Cutaneotrichosporon cavernicola]|uniref:Uncharacterized protein n=1 Tax=Cutaneotrichosporon cavernicola TaxID=279322 RepID=A0AA48I6Y3_9TREE|nr:uncharacterized protein CcaverHIS019_0100500 [Cutaneotrichosporon cavernicola]BEI79524.1 hypothetical protein CcaverHIS002_0100530 [Cutaneotrichosporon cavernicola]BEI87332.1 hypothetical protein CcaverHIS019_0100500 [Cutaneotrichosporon cavernicola]BEI95102.1 hypothetical protein CcaverHIS631_0100510 [Cutaneotrichosporon cavernicola]BEJ02876.1 hypothetical protein CcaverHIS641_0100510 [Cutaneotrichosporon cavernicola]
MSFQQLLKRSRFAVHDPLVTRVYASNTSSQRHGGDFGLKSPVNRPRMSRYIRLGKAISGWRSGEEEARFMAQWADGSIPWASKADRRLKPASILSPYTESTPEPEAVVSVLPNVDAMNDAEFQSYLQDIRARRSELRETVFSEMDVAADEATLPHAAAKGIARDSAAADFQVEQTQKDLKRSTKTIQPRPHRLHGLQYSSAPAAGAALHGRAIPGRALDRVNVYGQRSSFRALEGTNAEWVVGLGGLTATGGSGVSRVTDKASLSQFDYSRERPERGIAKFSVTEATVEAPPKVLALGVAGKRWLEQPHFSGARRPAPLQTFRFDLRVNEDAGATDASGERILPGSAEWVAREPSRGLTEAEGAMGLLGGPRAKRPSLASHRTSTRAQSDTIDSLLARIAGSAGGR